MKLPRPTLDLATQLLEFDVWITPSLGEIRDTERFREELAAVIQTFEVLGLASQQFKDVEHCRPSNIAKVFANKIRGLSAEQALNTLQSMASVLFLVTGKSELKAEKYMRIVTSLGDYPDHQMRLLEQFISFLLSDPSHVSQLWSIGYSYFMMKSRNKEKDLLTPLVIFQVRGSVAASGGHDPEDMLRQRMMEWGLDPESDFNSSDVELTKSLRLLANSTVADEAGAKRVSQKTRAYDFILPYQVAGWRPKVFVQSQFYAGDSGSVSHKNVDQTSTSRNAVLNILETPIFVEYVDGAGYFSSLNGDLKKLLEMPTTASFFQVRSAAIRLRRELQHVGFLMPLEVEHAVFRADGSQAKVRRILGGEGYPADEIERCINKCIKNRILLIEGHRLSVAPARRVVARRYFLLDVASVYGSPPATTGDRLSGSLLVPGHGPFHGTKFDDLAAHALRLAPGLNADWSDPTIILGDIRWLCDQGMAMSS